MLSQTLKNLERDGMLTRTVVSVFRISTAHRNMPVILQK
jgi:DNA-binding HxlR family transcriptional regulator